MLANVLRRWWFILILAALAAVLIAASLSAAFCKSYWGYVLRPPGVEPRVLGATRLLAHSTIWFSHPGDDAGKISTEPRPAFDLAIFAYRRDDDYTWRLVPPAVDPAKWREDWVRRGVIPAEDEVAAMALERCRALPGLIESTAGLVRGDYGVGFPDPRAHIDAFELLGPRGERLLFVALYTGELSNDHLGYYELLYDDSVSPPRLLDRRHWRFDVAGIEGFEFALVTVGLSIALLLAFMPVTSGVLLYRRFSRGARIARGCCPMCDYNLEGSYSRGCPECGWGIGEHAAEVRDLRRYRLGGRMLAALTRPPGWRTMSPLALGAALIWYGRSMPSNVPWAIGWGSFLLLVSGSMVVFKSVGSCVRPRWLGPAADQARAARKCAGALGVIAAAVAGLGTQWPLQWRFAASRAALERAAADARAAGFPNRAPRGMNALAGLFIVRGVGPTNDGAGGMIVWVGEAGGRPVMRSFVWYPERRPGSPSAYGSQLELGKELSPGWFLWDYLPARVIQ